MKSSFWNDPWQHGLCPVRAFGNVSHPERRYCSYVRHADWPYHYYGRHVASPYQPWSARHVVWHQAAGLRAGQNPPDHAMRQVQSRYDQLIRPQSGNDYLWARQLHHRFRLYQFGTHLQVLAELAAHLHSLHAFSGPGFGYQKDMAEALIKRKRTFSPDLNRPVQFCFGVLPLTRKV